MPDTAEKCVINRILIIPILVLLSCGEKESVLSKTRVMIIGVDGADWNVVDSLIERGSFPTSPSSGNRA